MAAATWTALAATIRVLPEIAEAVGDKATVILDSGVRRGSDIAKALALGAKAVLTGRATLYGTAVGGEAGASKAINLIRDELDKTMAYTGCNRVDEITTDIFFGDRERQPDELRSVNQEMPSPAATIGP